MKRGMKAFLGTIAFVMLASASFANAPVFRTVPHIVIGDFEDNIGMTVDQNIFRYINALNIAPLVSDVDSPATSLKFAYLEASSHNDVSINDKRQLDLVGEFPNVPASWNNSVSLRLIPNGSFIFSFRDTYRSPLPNAAPYPDPLVDPDNVGAGVYTQNQTAQLQTRNAAGTFDPGGRAVVLYVADDHDNVDSTTLLVFSVNNGTDGLSGAYTTVFSDSLANSANWRYVSIGGMSAATSASGSGFLRLTAGATATGFLNKWFARWETNNLPVGQGGDVLGITQRIPYISGNRIYVARFALTPSGNALKHNLPSIRLGAFLGGNNIQIVTWIGTVNGPANLDPTANPQIPNSGVQRIYPVYWSSHDWTTNFNRLLIPAASIDARTWAVFFDVHDANQQAGLADDSGSWELNSLEVLSADRPPTQAPAINLTDLGTTGSWGLANESPNSAGGVTVAQNTPAAGQITFTDPGSAATAAPAQYLMWGYARNTNVGLYTWDNQLRRATIELSCPTTTHRNNFHRVRFRHLTFAENVFQEMYIRQQFLSEGNPMAPPARDAGGKQFDRYEQYVAPYGGSTALLQLVGWHLISPVVDQLYNIPGETNALATQTTVHRVYYETFAEPTF